MIGIGVHDRRNERSSWPEYALTQHGIEPAPERQKRTTWQEFLKAHWEVRAAADFFTVEA